jgi:hypothetical protein
MNCGSYWITGTALAVMNGKPPAKRHLLAHLIRRRARTGERVQVTSKLVDAAYAEDAQYPNAMEQVENLLIHLAEHIPYAGEPTDITIETHRAIIGAATPSVFRWTVQSARERGWIDGVEDITTAGYALLSAALTLSGWEWYEATGRRKRSRIAFMAMKFGDVTLDAIVNEHFRPAVSKAGFALRRLDDEPQAGIIDNRLRVEIRRSRLLICDLSHRNPGAYWEGGFAEGIGIPVIYTCEESKLNAENLHFDTRNCLTVGWRAEAPAKAAELLTATIRNTLPDEATLVDPDQTTQG